MASLEPTYKGLKHGGVVEGMPLRSCLEPTYKGLKLSMFQGNGFKKARLEPTYKGLKQDYKMITLEHGYEVWSLPIRD